MINKLKKLFKDKGFVISFFLSILVLVVFFSNLLFHANSVYFGTDGDGLQIYYTSLFHVFHDKSYLYQEAMNYPYKESVFFTGCQPVITDFIKFWGLHSYTIGILNLTMLLSLPISVWFLYFIFKEFNVHYLIAALASVAIGYFTPQVCRMAAHYTLAYSFAIPAIIYLMIRFYKNPSFKKSFAIAMLVFFMASTHMYFFLFYSLIITAVWGAYFFNHNFRKSFLLFVKHFSIQLILPLLLLQFIIFILNDATDRTKHPWGFFEYMSNLSGVFYPFGRYYEYLFKNNNLESTSVSGEGIAFVGLCATLLTVILALKVLRSILNFDFKNILNFTNSPILNSLIVCGVVSLLYSFGWPFIFGYEKIVYKLGFLQQMRALGRFAWIFFYVINIALIVIIYNLPDKINKFYFKWILMCFVLFVLSYDAYMNILNYNKILNNRITELNDPENTSPENQWLKGIDFSQFQAIIPFPYFHVGSENVGIEPKRNSSRYPFIVSLKTGLPIVAVLSSRISLSQTYKNIALVTEPNGRIPQVLNEFKNQKDLLIVVQNQMLESAIEKRIISLSEKMVETTNFSLYRLKYDNLKNYFQSYYSHKKTELLKQKMFPINDYFSSDSLGGFVVKDMAHENADPGFVTKGFIKGKASDYFTLFNDSVAWRSTDSVFVFSFWLNNFNSDMYPRGTVSIDEEADGSTNTLVYTSLKDCFKQIEGNWVLIECKFKRKNPKGKIKAVIWNNELINNEFYQVDDMLLKSSGVDVYCDFGDFMLINNYIYHRD